jgi:peptidoglycan/LPS O-acetylase OafA/YrhL
MYAFAFLYLALFLLAFVPRLRRTGALCLAVVAVGSLFTICTLHSTAISFGQFLFLLPCIAAAILGAWLFARDGRSLRIENAA